MELKIEREYNYLAKKIGFAFAYFVFSFFLFLIFRFMGNGLPFYFILGITFAITLVSLIIKKSLE